MKTNQMTEATAAGWKPDPVEKIKTHYCATGCGRSITDAAGGPVCGFICVDCRQSMAAYLAVRRRQAAKNAKAGQQ